LPHPRATLPPRNVIPRPAAHVSGPGLCPRNFRLFSLGRKPGLGEELSSGTRASGPLARQPTGLAKGRLGPGSLERPNPWFWGAHGQFGPNRNWARGQPSLPEVPHSFGTLRPSGFDLYANLRPARTLDARPSPGGPNWSCEKTARGSTSARRKVMATRGLARRDHPASSHASPGGPSGGRARRGAFTFFPSPFWPNRWPFRRTVLNLAPGVFPIFRLRKSCSIPGHGLVEIRPLDSGPAPLFGLFFLPGLGAGLVLSPGGTPLRCVSPNGRGGGHPRGRPRREFPWAHPRPCCSPLIL